MFISLCLWRPSNWWWSMAAVWFHFFSQVLNWTPPSSARWGQALLVIATLAARTPWTHWRRTTSDWMCVCIYFTLLNSTVVQCCISAKFKSIFRNSDQIMFMHLWNAKWETVYLQSLMQSKRELWLKLRMHLKQAHFWFLTHENECELLQKYHIIYVSSQSWRWPWWRHTGWNQGQLRWIVAGTLHGGSETAWCVQNICEVH